MKKRRPRPLDEKNKWGGHPPPPPPPPPSLQRHFSASGKDNYRNTLWEGVRKSTPPCASGAEGGALDSRIRVIPKGEKTVGIVGSQHHKGQARVIQG